MTASSATKRGLLIVFEGGDRSGKSTQCEILFKALCSLGHSVKMLRFPDRTTSTGEVLDSYLKGDIEINNDHAVHLLFSANRWECIDNMKELLLSGQTLLIDRYVASGMAFSMAKGVNESWCKLADTGLIKPDITFFFDISPDITASRSDYGNERFEKLEIQQNVYAAYKSLQDSSWKMVNATLPINKLSESILKEVLAFGEKNCENALNVYL